VRIRLPPAATQAQLARIIGELEARQNAIEVRAVDEVELAERHPACPDRLPREQADRSSQFR
jgi:hypothetical protein